MKTLTTIHKQKISEKLRFPREIRKCKWYRCNNTFDVRITNKKTKIFCSHSCANSYANTTRIWSVKQRKEHSNRIKQTYKDGKLVYGGTTKWISVLTSNGLIKVQGTYEERMCKILDGWKANSKIKDWEYTNDRVQYVGMDNKIHWYLIDFKIFKNDNTFYYLETKGRKTENDEFKWDAVKKLGYNLKILYEKDIKKYEVAMV